MDSRVRELERKWKETADAGDRQAYAQALKRTGDFDKIAQIYQPILEETPELHSEYLSFSPLLERDALNLTELISLLQFYPLQLMRIWQIGSSVLRTDYNDVDLLIATTETQFRRQLRENVPQFEINEEHPLLGLTDPRYVGYANLNDRIPGTYNETSFDLCVISHPPHNPPQFNDDRLRMRLR